MRLDLRLRGVWRTLVRWRRLEQELDDELRGYVEALIERRVNAGQPPADARRAVLVEIGSVETVKEQVREARIGHLLEETWRDVA